MRPACLGSVGCRSEPQDGEGNIQPGAATSNGSAEMRETALPRDQNSPTATSQSRVAPDSQSVLLGVKPLLGLVNRNFSVCLDLA
jgi:hypothetical protein